MAVTIKVNGASLSLVHKGSNGFVKNTLPDVCKTPSPGGPVPIPYPVIISFSMNLRNGTKTVKADGGNMIAVKGSEFSRCIGDEPGTAGGVKSQTNMKEAKWLLYSFDVKMDGKNACRLTDKMTMNHGNTVSLGGEEQLRVAGVPDHERDIKCAIHECDNKKYTIPKELKDASHELRCANLVSQKHACVANHPKVKNREPGIYSETFVDMTSNPPNILLSSKTGEGVKNFFQARSKIGMADNYVKGSLRRPDLMYLGKNGQRIVADAKFPCPETVLDGPAVMNSPQSSASMLTGEQQKDYKKIQNNGKNPQEIQPTDCNASDCD